MTQVPVESGVAEVRFRFGHEELNTMQGGGVSDALSPSYGLAVGSA